MERIRKILDLYTRGSFSASTQASFREWLSRSWKKQETDRALSEYWDSMNSSESAGIRDARKDLRDIHRRLGWRGRGVFLSRWAVAAGAAAVLALFLAEYFFLSKPQSEMTVLERTCLVASESGKSFYHLPDGSRIWLNSGSKLTYDNQSFCETQRTVTLTGEGFFDVAEDKDRPFVVMMGDKIGIKVLGTEFNARTPLVFDKYQVSLKSGRAEIIGIPQEIVLHPGQQCTMPVSLGQATVHRTDISNYSSWISETVSFDNRSLGDILINLEHWFNARVVVSDKIDLTKRLSFTLRPEPVEYTLDLLSKLTGYSFGMPEPDEIHISTH